MPHIVSTRLRTKADVTEVNRPTGRRTIKAQAEPKMPNERQHADATRVAPKPHEEYMPHMRTIRAVEPEERNDHGKGRPAMENFNRGAALETVNGLIAPASFVAKTLDYARQKATGSPFNFHEFEAPITEQKRMNEEFFDPGDETSSRAGRLAGMVVGELPYYIGGGALLKHGIKSLAEAGEAGSMAERVHRFVDVAESPYRATRNERIMRNGIKRALGQAATSMPVAATLGAANTPQGEDVTGPAVKSAVAWGASGLAAEPAMNMASRGIGALIERGVPRAHISAGIKSLGANVSQAAAPYVHRAVPRVDDYVKYDIGDRTYERMSDIQAKAEMEWARLMGKSRD